MSDLSLPSILLSIFAFGMIIFIHEFGHYLAAIKVGVRVEKFYLGFDFWGMKLFKFDYKGTEYGIGVFPLGGYVKMAGQNDFGQTDSIGHPDEFTSKSVWERIQVLAAGVIFNFISAFFFMGGALLLGHQMLSPIVGQVMNGSPAWKSGLKEGDKVLSFNSIPITSFDSLSTEVALSDVDVASKIVIERDGKKIHLNVTPELNDMDIPFIGFRPILVKKVKSVLVDSPAEKAGIRPGDIIEKVDGVPLKKWTDLSPLVQASGKADKALKIDVFRNAQTVSLTFKPEAKYSGDIGMLLKRGTEITAIRPGSFAEMINLKVGMTLLSINGKRFDDLSEITVDESLKDFEIVLATRAGEQTHTIPYSWKKFQEAVYVSRPKNETSVIISKIETGSIADKMGLLKGDEVTAFKIGKSQFIEDPSPGGLTYSIAQNKDQAITLKIKRAENKELTVSSKIGVSSEPHFLLGLESQMKAIEGEFLKTTILWPLHLLRMTYKGLLRMFTGKVSSKHISGPVGIAKMTYQMASTGLSNLFYFMAILSISIAFFNCLPVPVLDGGQLLFCVVEWVKGSPVSEQIMLKVQYLGFAFILVLLIFATWNDLTSKL